MNWIKELWQDWKIFTWIRAQRNMYITSHIYGTGIVKENWWGWSSVDASDIFKGDK